MNRIRREKIKEYIENRSFATIKELQELVPGVSLMTIHRDLDFLEDVGAIAKYRGGARSIHHPDDVEFNIRKRENNEGKLEMAKKALSLIQPHSSIFIDAGTSSLFLAQHMPDININVVTTGPSVALELCRLRNPVVTMCCGVINRKNLAVSGLRTLELLDDINIDTAFVGVSGCSAEVGFTCGTESDMLIKRKVIQKARVTVMLCSNEKLKRLMPYTFASLKDVDYIVSDKPMPEEFAKIAAEEGVVIL